MKIARVCRPLVQPAGTERSIIESSRELSRMGVDVRIYTPSYKQGLFDGIGDALVEEVRTPIMPFFDLYSDLIITKKLVSVASRWADVITLHHGHALASYCARRFSVPCIPYFHNDKRAWYLYGNRSSIAPLYNYPLLLLEAKCLSEIPLVFANSETVAGQIREYAHVSNIVTIDLGIDTSRFHPIWGKDEGFVLMSGRFNPACNFELGVETVTNRPYRVVIAGVVEKKSLHYYKLLTNMVRDRSGHSSIDIATPSETELIQYLQACSVYLSTRQYEYLGRAALEAMACGKPVIAHRVGNGIEGDPPVIECGSDSREWTKALDDLMNDPQRRLGIGKRSYEFVNEKHTLRESVEKMLRAIKLIMRDD